MIKNYEVTTFTSYKNRTFFDFEKTNYQMLLRTNVNGGILKGMMFVGPNASGKSNSILAIKILLDLLLGKNDVSLESAMCLFSPNPTLSLKYTFQIDDAEIEYGFTYQRIDKIITEKLCVNRQEVFSRNGSVASVFINEPVTHTDVPSKTLFLRDVYFNTKFRGNIILQKWYEFLSNSVYFDLYSKKPISYKDVDLSLKTYLDENGTDRINSFFEEYNFCQHVEYDKTSRGNIVTMEAPEKMIFFKRHGIDEPIPYQLESLGNITLINMLPAFFYCIENNGMLILDEFSSGFHNDLEELLVRYFMKNADRSQLIFVTHSTNLLTNSLMRPDQIYSVDFDNDGSRIKKFSSEKPREAQNLEKMYLSGVFDGVPKYENNAE